MLPTILTLLFAAVVQVESNEVHYTSVHDVGINGSSEIKETKSLSFLHCAQQCTKEASCVSANYERDNNKCQLLALSNRWLVPKIGTTAAVGQKHQGEFFKSTSQ